MNKYDKQYKQKQLRIRLDLEKMYSQMIDDLVSATSILDLPLDEYVYFKNYPTLKKKADELIKDLGTKLNLYINNQLSSVWSLSNSKNDNLIDQTFSKYDKIAPESLKSHNEKALETFRQSKIKGLALSDRVWSSNANLRQELESALSAGLEKGQSAKSLAKDIRKYLNEPNMRFRRVRDKFGNLKPSKNALSYNPGQGVYRNSQANALRLAKETINRAYREADHLRWSQMPFVIGYKLRNSERKATVCDICARMNGTVFPKSYKFIGFHIGCLCVATPVLCSESDMIRIVNGEDVEVKELEMPVL
nr:MAG TPA: minor capsid protein [Caudoviricetes sp.]